MKKTRIVAPPATPRAPVRTKKAPAHKRGGTSSLKLTPLQVAEQAFDRDWWPVPIQGKEAYHREWPKRRFNPYEQPELFNVPRCTGAAINLGASGITDMESDCQASALALRALAPPTGCVTKSPSQREHYIYSCQSERTLKFQIACRNPTGKKKAATLVELRGGNNLSVLPGSIHPDYRKPYCYVENGEPSKVKYDELKRAATLAATAGALAEYYPERGARQDFTLAVAGYLRRSAVSEKEAISIVNAVTTAVGDEEAHARIGAVRATYAKPDDEATTGLPTIESLTHAELARWLRENLTGGCHNNTDELTDELARCFETDSGNGTRFARRHRDNVRYCPEFRCWFFWNGERWAEDTHGEVTRRAKDTAKGIIDETKCLPDRDDQKRRFKWALSSSNAHPLRNMLWAAQSEPGIAVSSDDFDSDAWVFNCANGVLDLRTGELYEHDRSRLITKLSSVTFDPDEICPTWDSFLLKVMAGRQHMVDYLQRIVGAALTGVPPDRVMFFLYGSGRNGKSTFIETLHELLGSYAKKTSAETLLVRSGGDGATPDVAELKGARLVTSGELPEGRRLNEARIKDLTGRDRIKARFLYKAPFEFCPQFKLIMSGNHKPNVRGTDRGIWDRVKLIPFDVRIHDEEVETNLPDKLRLELPGILAWAVRGCQDWQRIGFQHPEEITAATNEYQREQDPLEDFLIEYCATRYGTKVENAILWQAYELWCLRNGERFRLGRKQFSQKLMERGFQERRNKERRCWLVPEREFKCTPKIRRSRR